MTINWDAITKLPAWLAKQGGELEKFRKGAVRFWQRFSELMKYPAQQLDPMTADLQIVHLLAWERDIEQIPSETELMYRTRVKYALPFAKGAGSVEGWQDMFAKLGSPWIEIGERQDDIEWDVINLELDDKDFGGRQNLIDYLCRKYGRTARRYQFSTMTKSELNTALIEFNNQSDLVIARIGE